MPTITFGAGERRFVYSVARRIVRTDEDADDVAQEALLLAHRHRASFRGEAALRTWLYRIATTTALGHLRRARRTRGQVALADHEVADPAKSAEQAIADAEVGALVREELSKLKPAYREILLVRAHVTENETAERLGISVANVKVRAHRARNQLRAALEPLLGVAA